MKLLLVAVLAAAVVTPAFAQASHSVRGYTRRDGTYVAPHYQSSPDSTKLNDYSTQGNYNPYSGQSGTVNPYTPTQNNPYGTPYNSGHPH